MSKELVIRREQPADYAAVEQVVRDAFWNVYTPACTEHYLLHIIRTHPAFVPELDMVALVGEKIVGCVVYMRSFILACNGTRYETLTLGPIAVLPEYQRQGVGRSLISQSREAARRMGFRAILLCGDPDYYLRRGFVPAETYGICNSEGLYMEGLHACELYEGALADAEGRYHEDAIYDVDEAAARAFDRQFRPRKLWSAHLHRDASRKWWPRSVLVPRTGDEQGFSLFCKAVFLSRMFRPVRINRDNKTFIQCRMQVI